FLEAGLSKSELIQKIDEYACVFRRGSHQNIKIACVTRSPMQGETVCTDDDIINPAGVDYFDQLTPVFAQAHGVGTPPECEDVRCRRAFHRNQGPLFQPPRNYEISLPPFPHQEC